MLKKIITKKAYQIISLAVRHGIGAIGGYVTGLNVATQGEIASLEGVAPLAIAVAWSLARKFLPADLKL